MTHARLFPEMPPVAQYSNIVKSDRRNFHVTISTFPPLKFDLQLLTFSTHLKQNAFYG